MRNAYLTNHVPSIGADIEHAIVDIAAGWYPDCDAGANNGFLAIGDKRLPIHRGGAVEVYGKAYTGIAHALSLT